MKNRMVFRLFMVAVAIIFTMTLALTAGAEKAIVLPCIFPTDLSCSAAAAVFIIGSGSLDSRRPA